MELQKKKPKINLPRILIIIGLLILVALYIKIATILL